MGKATTATMKSRVAALKALILSGSSNSTCVEHPSLSVLAVSWIRGWGLGYNSANRRSYGWRR